MNFKNHYKVLGLKDYASVPEIKKAYRRLAFQYHPDQNRAGQSGAARFLEIKEAYQVLTHPEKRQRFDAELRSLSFYSPSYEFGKYGRAPTQEDDYVGPEPPVRKKRSLWVQARTPLVLILVTIALMYLLMRPPLWLKHLLRHDTTTSSTQVNKKINDNQQKG